MKSYERKTKVFKGRYDNKSEALKSLVIALRNDEKGSFKKAGGVRREYSDAGIPSSFSTLKIWRTLPETRTKVLGLVGTEFYDKANEIYFLKTEKGDFIPASLKFDKSFYTMVSVALYDNQQIVVNGVKHVLNTGDVIRFNLNNEYELPEVETQGLWLCSIWLPSGIQTSEWDVK